MSTKYLPLFGARKLVPHFVGPFQVLQRVGNQAYRLQLSPTYAYIHTTFHILLLCAASDLSGPGDGRALGTGPGPVFTDSDGFPHYKIDRIIDASKAAYRV